MQEVEKAIFACVDGSKFSNSVCEYGIEISKTTQIPLKLLNTIEHSHKSNKVDFSGNLGLGEKDELLEELSNEDEKESKALINNGKELLNTLKQKANDAGLRSVITSQRHGKLYDNLVELQAKVRLLIIGLRGKDSQGNNIVGEQIEEILRNIEVPTLLVNQEFRPINKIMMAYDGSTSSIKALQSIVKSPLFKQDVRRYIVNVCNDERKSRMLLAQAAELLHDTKLNIELVSIKGEPLNELLKFQSEHDIDAIVMGAFSHGKIRSAIFGSFTSKMIQNSSKPLILIR
ncbi:MAG: universal stress protein [Arcobacteraceae bacterium]|jgi:nucleotide-binding universal stress UspA family protein|nr:universal stress protein [Arcobacteraceae bacterium]